MAPTLHRGLGIGQVVDVGEELDARPIGAEGRQVAIGDQSVLDVEEFALDLAIGGGRLLVGTEDHHAVASVDDHQVAALDFRHDAIDAGDRRDAPAPGQDRRMAGRTADLGDDPGDRQLAQAHRLAGQELVCDQDDRLVPVPGIARGIGMADGLAGQVRADPQDHVPDIGHPLPEEILLDPRELRRIALHDRLKGGQGGHLLVFDEVVDPGQQRRVVDDLQVALEDLGRGVAQLLGDLLDQGFQVGRRVGHGPVEPLNLVGDLVGAVQGLFFDRAEDRLHAVGNPHHDARTHADSFTHVEPVSRFRDDRTEGTAASGRSSRPRSCGADIGGIPGAHPLTSREDPSTGYPELSAWDGLHEGIRRRSRMAGCEVSWNSLAISVPARRCRGLFRLREEPVPGD